MEGGTEGKMHTGIQTASEARSAHAKGATEAEAESESWHFVGTDARNGKSSGSDGGDRNEDCAQGFVPSQRQEV
jgi:hypothetical protein